MAPRKKTQPPAADAPRAKRTRSATAIATPAVAAEEEANNSTQGVGSGLPQTAPPHGEAGTSQVSYDMMQQEIAELRREVATLRQPSETTLATMLRPASTIATGATLVTPVNEISAPQLRGDPNSPLSVGLEASRWPQGFKMPEVTPFAGCTDPSEFLRVYETAVEAAGGDDTTKAKSVTLALKGVALT